MTDSINIDKSLDKYSKDFSVRHTRNRLALAITAICMLPYILSLFIPSWRDGGFYAFAGSLFAFGAVILIVVIAYYFIGDSKRPYFKPSHDWMERCELYFDGNCIGEVKDMLSKGDFASLAVMPRKHSQPNLIVMYKAPRSNVICAQILLSDDGHFIPQSGIYMFRNGEHNVPKGKKLLDFFYKDSNN